MNQDTKSTAIGFVLIAILMFAWQWYEQPNAAQIAAKRQADSAMYAQRRIDSLAKATVQAPIALPDSVKKQQLAGDYGAFAAAAAGTEQFSTLENDVFKITFTNKGGRIKEVLLKKHTKIDAKDEKKPLKLLEDDKNLFEYHIPANVPKGLISTGDLYFTPAVAGNAITYTANVGNGIVFEQKYVIGNNYNIDYDIRYEGLGSILKAETKAMTLNWTNWLDKLEKNADYERNYTSLYYREADKNPDYCSCTKDDRIELAKKPVKWVSSSNQFFSSSLIAKTGFQSAIVKTEMANLTSDDLKKTEAQLAIPMESGTGAFGMQMYVGPNEFTAMRSYGIGLEDVISYGNSLFGSINRWLIRPIFNFFNALTHHAGISILLLTLLVKLLLYPLSYKMLYSQAKTLALKPRIDKMKEKMGGDQQKVQVETMKLYQEFGVNPLGGCMPTLLQMPIWMALFRFFPATIDFRQQSFLWATDLTSYEIFAKLPFNIPGYGSHISLFAFLWAISLLVFTWYTSKDVDYSAQPAMKYVQYLTPVMFMFMFNSYAAGLSLYMLFSNILNIGQTVVTKNYVIDNSKVLAELEENKKNPKPKSAWRSKIEEAVSQQQQMQEQIKKQEQQKKK
jgi:YidC/Oxa1 family membrane protein insertase